MTDIIEPTKDYADAFDSRGYYIGSATRCGMDEFVCSLSGRWVNDKQFKNVRIHGIEQVEKWFADHGAQTIKWESSVK